MYTEHSIFNPPPLDAILWRYMDFAKFVSMLDSSALYFVRADKLGDPFEGTFSPVNSDTHSYLYSDVLPDVPSLIRYNSEQRRRYCAVNCWHWNDHESDAMWKLYGGDKGGIAIRTTFDSLKTSFTDSTDIYIGQITYVDYDSTSIPEMNYFSAFLHKRKSFEHEREVRAVIADFPPLDDNGALSESPDVWDIGRSCTVNLLALIHGVVVSPLAERWLFELVQSVVKKYGLPVPVTHSTISKPPYGG